MLVATGSAFGIETGVPYGALADALGRALRALDASTLTILSRGADADLRAIIPGLGTGSTSASVSPHSDEGGKAQLFWNVTQFLTRLAARQPLLLVLDNAHESDPSSLELLHFFARQLDGTHVLLILAYADGGLETNAVLRGMVRSLRASSDARSLHIEPLTAHDLVELLQRTFALPPEDAERHGAALWSHTRGNPFFVDESLKALASANRIRRIGTRWHVEDTTPTNLPATVTAAVRARLDAVTPDARRLVEIVAIGESRASLPLLEHVSGLSAIALADAIDVLCSGRILVEHREHDDAHYEFAHPIIQSTVRGGMTAARERAWHAAVAGALESIHGEHSLTHATAIARHLVQGDVRGDDDRMLRYLGAAGRDALARRADPEAARWLSQALTVADRIGDVRECASLLEALGTAQRRNGDVDGAQRGSARALALAEAHGDDATCARLLMLQMQDAVRSGDTVLALRRLEAAAEVAARIEHPDLLVRVLLEKAKLLQAVGRNGDATETLRSVLAQAESRGDTALLARVHQTALQLYAWTGPASVAREHGARALELAAASGDREVAWSSHWAMAMLEGFTGAGEGVALHTRAAAALADALAAPELQAMTAEIMIEHASAIGSWEEALRLAERTMPLARAVMPGSLLPRLLVWTGLIVLARDDAPRARALFDEAWHLSGAERAKDTTDGVPLDLGNVHNVILAHTGMGTWHLVQGDWIQAVEYGERGLVLAERFGYVAWAIHRLIPLIIEARLRLHDYDRVEALATRLRTQSTALGHRLGLAWATAADALLARVRDRRPDTAARLLAAADELETVPFVFHAAKIRRNAAQVLEADGDVDAAVRELRTAHDVFVRLGAEFELRGTRDQLRALGVRLPPRQPVQGRGTLTGRELEIARAVARRLSNKEIGASLEISARTVSTHLSNIFEKLGVDSRGALADHVREHLMPGDA